VTARCTRFEEEALLLIEQGLPLDPHFSECAECRAAQASYSRIEEALRTSRRAPRRGWQDKVLAAIDRAPAAAPRSWPRRAAWGAGALAAAVVVAIMVPPMMSHRSPAEPSISTRVVPGDGQTLRGDSPHSGDILQLNAIAGGAHFVELRVYRGDRDLIFQCASPASIGAVSCTRSGKALEARLRFPSRGLFQALIAASGDPLPPPAGSLAEDTARLLRAHARIALAPPVRAY
jgi:hypothetical protein